MTAAWVLVPVAVVPVALPVAVLGLLTAVARPAEVSIVFLALTYFKLNEVSPVMAPLGYLLSLGSVLVSAALGWHLLFSQRIRPDFNGPHAAVAILWLFVSAGVVTAQDHAIAVQAWSDYSKTLLLALAVLWFMTAETHIRLLVRLLILGGIVISGFAIANAWSGINLVEGTRAVAGDATLSNPNDLALILLLPLSFGATLLLTRGLTLDRMLGLLGTLEIGYAITLTQSRGGLLGVLAVFAVIGGRFVRSRAALVGLGIGLTLLLYAAMGIADRESGGAGDAKGESAQDRIYAWHAGVNMAKAFPLTGVGIGNFTTQFSSYSPEAIQHPITAHSIWFLILGEAGLPGLLAFVTLVAMCLGASVRNIAGFTATRASLNLQAAALGTTGALAGYLVSGSFLSYVYQWPLYVLVALIAALGRILETSAPRAVAHTPGGRRAAVAQPSPLETREG